MTQPCFSADIEKEDQLESRKKGNISFWCSVEWLGRYLVRHGQETEYVAVSIWIHGRLNSIVFLTWPLSLLQTNLYAPTCVFLETRHGVKTCVIDVDFTGGREIYDRIGTQLQDLDIGVLVNNVGMSYNYPEFLCYLPDAGAFCTRLMHCNILSVTGMTLLLLPKMAEKRKGLILNVSSASAVLPSPLLSMYSSTKVKKAWKSITSWPCAKITRHHKSKKRPTILESFR